LAAAETIWIVDPVDGTSNYSRQLPIFSISIGVAHRAQMIVGVIYDPLREELFRAVAGQGATCGGRRLTVSKVVGPTDAILALDWGHAHEMRGKSLALLNRLAHQVQTIRALGSAALALAWVAAGRLDAYFNVDLKPWDVAAGALILTEAGGQISRLDGRPCNWQEPSMSCLASNSLLHASLLQIIADQPP
jgi:myo-inositol-1(or 4)-monophosphatase